MDIKFTQRLSYKQARLTVLVGFILGALLSVIQIGIDYSNVDEAIDRQMRSLLEISHNPASRIAYNIDAELAKELTLGLLQSESIIGARLTDNNGNVLASVQRPRLESSYRFLSDILFDAQRQYEDSLFLTHMPHDRLGTLQLSVDTFAIGNRFLRRAEITLASGFLRTALLTGMLLGFFYLMLTKPLNRVIGALSSSDPHQPKPARLDYPPGHEHDEIGVLVKVANQQFISMATEIQQRRSAENRLTEYLGELENIVSARTTELKASNIRLSMSNEELEKARRTALDMAQARASFLANMSHEIRTPINSIIGITKLLQLTDLNEEQQEMVNLLDVSSNSLSGVINDILDLSKIESGKFKIVRGITKIHVICKDVLSILKFKAKEKGIDLILDIEQDVPETVIADSLRLNQILTNLISNAIKFTIKGSVTLKVVVRDRTETECMLKFSVIDTGIGIAKSNIDKIFESFEQAEDSTTLKFGGTGLGLSIVKQLAALKNGILEVSSEEFKGSTFSFSNRYELPQVKLSPVELPVSKGLKQLEGIRILVAEDNAINQFLILRILKSWNTQADVVENGQEAIDRLKAEDYNIVLMDTFMPVMNGLEAIKLIRQGEVPGKENIPIITFSAAVMEQDRQTALEAGANDILSKPFDVKRLHGMITDLCMVPND